MACTDTHPCSRGCRGQNGPNGLGFDKPGRLSRSTVDTVQLCSVPKFDMPPKSFAPSLLKVNLDRDHFLMSWIAPTVDLQCLTCFV